MIDEVGRLERIDYGDRVFYDAALGIAGTTYPIGTAGMPSDVIADAITICGLRFIDIIHVSGVLPVGGGIAQVLIGRNVTLTAQTAGTATIREASGVLVIDAMVGGSLTVVMNSGAVIINADCTAGTINIYGSATITDNSVIGCTVNDYTEQDDRAEHTAAIIAADMTLATAFATGNLAGAGAEATLFTLDAIAGTKKDVKVVVSIDAAPAGNIEERWYMDTLAAPGAFIIKHPTNAAHNPGAIAILTREFGDLPEGLQLQFRIHSAGNDAGVGYEAEMTYLE